MKKRAASRLQAMALLYVLAVSSSHAFAQSGDPSFRDRGGLLDASAQRRPSMLSFFIGFPYAYSYYGFPLGISGRYYAPVLHDGFIPTVNDSFGIEFGADLALYSRGGFATFLAIPIEAMWALHFFPKFAMYLKLGVALDFRLGRACNRNECYDGFGVGAYPIGTLGFWYALSDVVRLRFELGYPWIKIGLGFAI
jgi:hypothetical protein